MAALPVGSLSVKSRKALFRGQGRGTLTDGSDGDKHPGGLLGRDCWRHVCVSIRQNQASLEAAERKWVVWDFEPGICSFNRSCQGGLMRFQLKFLLRGFSLWGDKPQSWRELRISAEAPGPWGAGGSAELISTDRIMRSPLTPFQACHYRQGRATSFINLPTRGPRYGAHDQGGSAVHRTRAFLFWP